MRDHLAKFIAGIIVLLFVVFPLNFIIVLAVAKFGAFEEAGFGDLSKIQIFLIAWLGTFLVRL